MSLVLALSSGERARTSPWLTFWPGSTERIASTESKKRASPPRDSLATAPFLSLMTIAGLRSVPRGVERQSITWRLVIPVDSSVASSTEMPSTTSSK
ncbi:hypothetical protein D9M70_459580 [compost metagenome]